MNIAGVNVKTLAQTIRKAGRPLHINVLARAAIRAQLEAEAGERLYAPGARYTEGETIRFQDQPATVTSVQAGGNPEQGPFTILTLRLSDGTERLMVAEVPDAPAEDRQPVTEALIEKAWRAQEAEARRSVQAALAADPRFAHCQTLQGDLWCLVEMLPAVSPADLKKALVALPGELAGEEPASCTTEELVRAIWGLEDDGSDTYALHAFALYRALTGHGAVVCLGDCWASKPAWEAFTTRPPLTGPAMPTQVSLPDGTAAATEAQVQQEQRREAADEDEEPGEEPAEQDLETWRQDRSTYAVLTLRARHYYEGWLPLSKQVRRLFPLLAADQQEVVFHHHFGDEAESFRAWVDREQGRVWVSPDMYETFRQHRIYPGARLRLGARSEREYDIATRPTDKTDPVRVWRMWLEDGQIQYEAHEEPRRYDVDDDVYVADVRFEDREALFRQAEEVGNSVFGLMYQKAVEWWKAQGRQALYVTADQLFGAIHYDERGRMTSPATIAWELWRRLAFKSEGSGHYLFRPEFGDRTRIAFTPRIRRPRHRPPTRKAPAPEEREPTPPTKLISEFWTQVTRLAGQELYTLDHNRPFRVLGVSDKALRILVATTGQTREIRRQTIEDAWNHLVREGQITRKVIHQQYSEFNPAYVAAILAALSGVTHQIRPIRLTYQSPAEEVPVPTVEPTPLPDYELPLLQALVKAGGQGQPSKDVYPRLEATMDLNEADHARRPGGNILWKDNAYFAFEKLVAKGEAEKPAYGIWRVIEKGRERLAGAGLLPPLAPIQERTRSGQLVAPGLVPPGPLFDTQPKADGAAPAPPEPGPEPPPGPPSPPPAAPPPSSKPSTSAPRRHSRRDDMQTKTLFSRHYLDTRLPDHPEWSEDPRPAFEAVRALWQKAHQFGAHWNEYQTEDEFVRPVLEALGWSFIVQPKAGGKGGRITRPDYALFANVQAKNEAQPLQGDDDAFYGRARAIAEAKYWGRPLSQKDVSGRNTWKTDSNPSHQMVSYLVGTRVPWGILTNGQTWRLYSREVSSTASEFYEVDLGLLFDFLAADAEPSPAQLDQFRRWWLFFRRDAFLPDAQGRSFVQRVHEGSATYAREISDKLKELIFEQVVPEIAGGFVVYRCQERGIAQETDESLREIYAATLSLLYKLLFLLYAEARGLLPVNNPGYREQSLTAMAQWAADRLDRKQPISDATHATSRYDALLALFHRIDQGDPSLGIPRYNGGLFNPASPENRFLEAHKLSDRAVACAVDILVRDAGEPVDYAYISVRNLGAIYEGLLENKLRVADADATAGQVELVNDKGERKASGSYYTPDYIVEYIVQHTLDPILDERQARFEAAMERGGDLRRQIQRTSDTTAVRLLRTQLDEAERDAREAFLGIKVCDPAMGSGHFLVNAVDHLTDGIIQRMQTYHDAHPDVPWDWNPIQRLIERVRGEILGEMERQGIAVDEGRLDDTALLTRLVMKRCIYGVDLNPLAVELAKLSLWLHSFTVGAPLSFLDHHLRWGNSLIGTDVRTVEREIKMTDQGPAVQLGLFAGPFAGLLDLTALMTEVAEQADATLADVQRSAEVFDEFQRQLTPYKQVLDLWVSQYFPAPGRTGGKDARDFLTLYGGDVLPALRGEQKVTDEQQAAIDRARALWRDKRFFHWDLEFPEVFVDLRRRDWTENPGFDAVIGNPPYVRSINLRTADESTWRYYSQAFESASRGEYDIYLCFVERGHDLLSRSGALGYILPNKWLTAKAGAKLREGLARGQGLQHLVHFGAFQVFEQVTTYTCLLFLAGQPQTIAWVDMLQSAPGHSRPLPADEGVWQSGEVAVSELATDVWHFTVGAEGKLLERLASLPKLGNIGSVFAGTGTRADPIFLLRREGNLFYSRSLEKWVELEPAIMRPSLTGRDIDPYYYDDSNWLLFPYDPAHDFQLLTPEEMTRRFPKAWLYLNEAANVAQLVDRDRGAFRARNDWYGFGRPQNHVLLGRPKLVFPDVAGQAEFACDLEGRYVIDTVYALQLHPDTDWILLALAAVLNCRMLTFFLQQTGTDLRGGYFRMKTAYLNPFPLPHIAFTTPTAERQRHAVEGRRLYERFCATNDATPVRGFVAHHLVARRSDVVHDLLAHLAEQMIAMNQQKQAEVKGFLAWLEREIGASIDDLTRKTHLRNYLGDYQKGEAHRPLEEILDILRRNHRRLQVDPSARAFQERLAREYQASLDTLLPLKARLAATDRLIDQVVYQLYGLTEDEIAIVENTKT